MKQLSLVFVIPTFRLSFQKFKISSLKFKVYSQSAHENLQFKTFYILPINLSHVSTFTSPFVSALFFALNPMVCMMFVILSSYDEQCNASTYTIGAAVHFFCRSFFVLCSLFPFHFLFKIYILCGAKLNFEWQTLSKYIGHHFPLAHFHQFVSS